MLGIWELSAPKTVQNQQLFQREKYEDFAVTFLGPAPGFLQSLRLAVLHLHS